MNLLRRIYYLLSPEWRMISRRVVYWPLDVWEGIAGNRSKYKPPRGQIYVGSGDFITQGIHQLNLLKTYAHLQPGDHILDIGCGIGRTAAALTTYLNQDARYEGFDVVEKGIEWCNSRIHRDHSNFNFAYVPLKNDLYNTHKEDAFEFSFPYEDYSFDKAFLFSVFTHMSVEEIAHYLIEISRVLKPGGICLATMFIYNNDSIATANQDFSFPIDKGTYKLMNEKVQSANIALKRELLDELVLNAGLEVQEVVKGYWKREVKNDRKNDFQDVVIIKSI